KTAPALTGISVTAALRGTTSSPASPPPEVKAELARLRGLYNPVQLQHHVNKVVFAQFSSSGREPAA
ncbi:MAG: hypothetical protein LBH85_00385, partial [Treponema sp.]|nr:hypothetical protein [Treponema sp.]